MISLCRRQIKCIVGEAFCASGEEVRLPPQLECTAPFITKSFVTQRGRGCASFIFKWAAKSFSLTSHEGFLNLGGCCNLSGISSSYICLRYRLAWQDTPQAVKEKKCIHSPFWDSSGGSGLFIYFSVFSPGGCILFCISSIRSQATRVTCMEIDYRAVTCTTHKICG